MYAALWRRLPGPPAVKWVITIVIAVAIFFLLMEVLFPWVSTLMPYSDVVV